MYKKILTIFALAASLLACNKVENEVVAPENGAKTLTITATLGDPATRLSYSEATDGSYKARFNNDDVVWAYFAKADNSVAGPVTKLAIDPKSISFDGKTACFRQPAVSIPEGSTKIIAYLANTANTTNFDGGDDIVSDISSQANLTAALNNQVIYGAVDFKDLTSTNPDALAASIPFSYKTSLLKFSLALPEGTEVDPKAAVSVTLANGKIHNKLHISGGVLGAKSEEGELKLGATVANGMVSAAAAVWAADDLNSKIFVNIGEDTFIADFKPAASIVAGKVYTVERTLAVSAKPVTMWANDDAASVDFKYSGGEDLTNDWLSCKSGKISWTANTTRAPRTAKLTFKNGSSFELTQVNPTDLKGEWTLYSKRFNPGGTIPGSKDSKAAENVSNTTKVTFGQPLGGETLKDDAGAEHTNIYGIKGLFLDAVLDAAAEIDYTAMTLKFGVFFDRRKAQDAGNGVYMAYLPECAKSNTWANYLFAPGAGAFSANDYDWLWFTSTDLKTLKYVFAGAGQQTGNKSYYICGISCVKAKSADASTLNVGTTSGYDAIYQANYSGSNTEGMYFTR